MFLILSTTVVLIIQLTQSLNETAQLLLTFSTSGAKINTVAQSVRNFSTFSSQAKHFSSRTTHSHSDLNYSTFSSQAQQSRSMNDHDQSNKTIITAFFLLNTGRHSNDEYFELMGRLFSSPDPMIIFTSPELAPKLAEMRRKPKRTVVIPVELKDMKVSKKYTEEFWWNISKHARGATMNGGYNPNLYRIWNSKVEFLKMGSDFNPFRSNFFAWVDAGLVRWDKYTNISIIQQVPPELPENKLMCLDVTWILYHKAHFQMGGGMYLRSR